MQCRILNLRTFEACFFFIVKNSLVRSSVDISLNYLRPKIDRPKTLCSIIINMILVQENVILVFYFIRLGTLNFCFNGRQLQTMCFVVVALLLLVCELSKQ